MTPWVSILTPLYNGVEFLEQCAMSVCLQQCQYKDMGFTWEWFIGVNGHGTESDVLERAKEIRNKCKEHIGNCRIHVVNLPSATGKVAALNALVPYTKGEWIALLDCDDTWERDKLLFQFLTVKVFPEIHVIGTLCRYFGEVNSSGPILYTEFISTEKIWESNPVINSSVLIRREFARWEDRFGLEDYDLWLRLAKMGLVFFNVAEYLVNHRIHRGSFFNGKVQNIEGLMDYHLYGIGE